MHIDWKNLLPALILAWIFIKQWTDKISKILQPIVEQIEVMAQDGVIGKDDRKKLAMNTLVVLQKQGYVKLNFLSRIAISFIIDRIAGKLPDFKISADAKQLIDEAKE